MGRGLSAGDGAPATRAGPGEENCPSEAGLPVLQGLGYQAGNMIARTGNGQAVTQTWGPELGLVLRQQGRDTCQCVLELLLRGRKPEVLGLRTQSQEGLGRADHN